MKRPPEERFWEKVRKTRGCWIWTACTEKGYGRFGVAHGDVRAAHRYSWEIAHGPIPEGLYVLHHCDNPPCVRPAHLWLGDAGDNNRDCITKGRRAKSYAKGEANPAAKLTTTQVRVIRRALVQGESVRSLARRFPVGRTMIQHIKHGRAWT